MLVSKNRCKSCKDLPGHRFCLRKDKHICWKCCNQMRSDLKCPSECEFRLRKKNGEETALAFDSKVDSKTEYHDLYKMVADYWIQHEVADLNREIPLLLSQSDEGKKKLALYLKDYKFPEFIAGYLSQRLQVKVTADQHIEGQHYEEFALDYMSKLLSGDWDKALDMVQFAIIAKEKGSYVQVLEHYKSQTALRKLAQFNLIAAGMAPRTKEAFVTFEINGSRELTLILMPYNESWIITNQVFGAINLITSENEGIRFIATSIANKDLDKAYRYLVNTLQIYYFSADLYYYQGLYYTLKGDNKHAREAYSLSIALDPFLLESQYNLAFIAQSENSIDEAKKLYKNILNISPEYIHALNNLGTIYLYEKKYSDAENCFNKCLELQPEFEYAKNNLVKLQELKS